MTFFNTLSGSVSQILCESYDDAKKMTFNPLHPVEKAIMKLLNEGMMRYINLISTDGVYYKNEENGYTRREDCDGYDDGVNRYLAQIFAVGKEKRNCTVLVNRDDLKHIVLGYNRKLCGKGVVINEISHWGVYILDKNMERMSKLNIGSTNSTYRTPELINAPSFKVEDPYSHFQSMKTYIFTCIECGRTIPEEEYYWCTADYNNYCKSCISSFAKRVSIPIDGQICKGDFVYDIERFEAFGFIIW